MVAVLEVAPVIAIQKKGILFQVKYGTNLVGEFKQSQIDAVINWFPGKKGKLPTILSTLLTVIVVAEPDSNIRHVRDAMGDFRMDIISGLSYNPEEDVSDIPDIPSSFPPYTTILKYFPKHQKHTFETLFCLLTAPIEVENPPWLALVSAPSVGKTFMLNMFNHPDLSLFVDDFTENSLAPGSANVESVEVRSLLEDTSNKTLVMNDLSSVFHQRADKINKFIGQLTTAYGGHYNKHSPGTGVVHHRTPFTLIMGMTYEIIRKHRKYMNQIGSRILVEYLPRGGDHVFRVEDRKFDKNILQLQCCGLVRKLRDEPLPEITKDILDELREFVRLTVVLRTMPWARSEEEVEGMTRLFQQLSYMIQCRARLHEREPNMSDLTFFKPLAWHTIGSDDLVKRIYKRCVLTDLGSKDYLRKMVYCGLELGIVLIYETVEKQKEYYFSPEYHEYCEEMFEV